MFLNNIIIRVYNNNFNSFSAALVASSKGAFIICNKDV